MTRSTLSGLMEFYGVKYEGQLKVIPTGGSMKAANKKVKRNHHRFRC